MAKQRVGAESYREVMNYLHNELGISKEDVRAWVQEAIMEIAQNYVDHQMTSDTLDNAILRIINQQWESKTGYFSRTGFAADLKHEVAKQIADRISLEV